MTKIRRPYSRVYWEVIDDPKFAEVWDDNHALSTWLRLLVAADMAWPASAQVYHGVHRPSLDRLVRVGLVDIQPGSRYRIHGLDKERQARARQASSAAAARWDDDEPPYPESNADGMRPHPPSNPPRMPSKEEQSKAEHKQSKSTDDAHAVMLLVEELTTWGFDYRQGHRVFETLVKDVAAHGAARIEAEYRAFRVANPGPMDPPQLVFGVHNTLHPFKPSGTAPAKGKGFNPTSDEAWEAFGGRPDVA